VGGVPEQWMVLEVVKLANKPPSRPKYTKTALKMTLFDLKSAKYAVFLLKTT
jgi:hypothetical protein